MISTDNCVSPEPDRSVVPDMSQRRSHQSVHDNASITHTEYREKIKDLEEYFPLKVSSLSPEDESPESASAKISLLHRYELVKCAESTLSLRQPMAFFALHLCIGIVASVFLNSSNSILALAGAILNFVSVALGNLKSVRRLLRFFGRGRSLRDEQMMHQ